MEKRPVLLRLESLQTQGDGTERVEQDLTGTLLMLEQGWALSYREPEASGLGETLTTLTAAPGKVILTREGETACHMVFRAGRRTLADYRTPYGRFDLEILTRQVSARLEDGAGRVELVYSLSLGGGEPGKTRLTITFREEE